MIPPALVQQAYDAGLCVIPPAPSHSPPQAAPMNMLPAALAYAQKLGWPVIPLHSVKDGHCTCNRVACKNQGKHPLGNLVPNGLKDASVDPEVITQWWRTAPWANIGVVTGAVSGLVVLDVDTIKGGDESLFEIQQERGKLPDTVMAVTGSGGNHYLLKHPGPEIKIKNSVSNLGRGLDIRGDGGYIVVAPSLHLHGRRYEWELSCRPLDASIAPIPEWLLARIKEDRQAKPDQPGPGVVGGPLDTATMARIRAALVYIDCEERDPWLEIGMALHSTGAGKQAYAMWCEWAQQSDKFDLKDSARVWRSFKPKNDGITLDTVFARGRAAGWVDPDQHLGAELAARLLRGASHTDSRFDAELQRANGQGSRYEARMPTALEFAPLPVPLLARLEAEILARAPMRCPLAAQITTKAIMAFVSGRQVVSQAGDPTGLYLAMAAPSVGDLRPYLAIARDVMEQINQGKAVRQQRLSNPAQIHKLLWRNPNLLHLCSEWGIVLQFAKRQPAGAIEQALTVLSEVWSGKPITMDVDDIKLSDPGVDGHYVIRAPHITILAALSHDQLATAMKLSEMGRGALEQIQYWILEDGEFEEANPDSLVDTPFPTDLIDELRTLATPIQSTGNLAGLTGPDQQPSQVTAAFSAPIQPFYAPLDTLPAHRSARSILSAARQIIRREATSFAFFLDRLTPVLTAGLIQRCVDSEMARLGRLLARFSSLSSEDGNLSAYQKVLDFITAEKGKGVRGGDLISGCWAYRGLSDDKREALVKQLLNDESIVEVYPETKPGARRKALIYVARQFAREVGK
jgi:hypothetical protein